MGDELFHGDRTTDMAKLGIPVRNFAKAPEITNHVSFKLRKVFDSVKH
jgi:hypothetical protein